jgi:hypothetical protein
VTISDHELTPNELKRLAGPLLSTPFDYGQRLFASFNDGKVFEYGLGDAISMKEMLRQDGGARKVEQVLTLPIRSAAWEIRAAPGGGKEATYVKAQLENRLGKVIDQMTTAVVYRKAFFELAWDVDGNGDVVLADIAWRPPATCEAGFDEKTGAPEGFRQRVGNPGGILVVPETMQGEMPGYVTVPQTRSFVFTHGSYREPIEGISDLDVAYWCWETRQKVLFLLFQFLEQQSLPKIIAWGNDTVQADRNADAIAAANASGVIGLERPSEPGAKGFEILESSGQGAAQFLDAIRYLESQMSASVLAGFTDLTAVAAGTSAGSKGSYALSADQSEFFLAARQAVADEMADAVSQDLFAVMCRYQFGADCKPPTLEIGPLAKQDKARSLGLLESLLTAQHFNAPPGFIDLLLKATAGYVGLPVDQVHKLVEEHPTVDPNAAPAPTPGATPAPSAPGAPAAAPVPTGPDDGSAQQMRDIAGLAQAVDVAAGLVLAKNGDARPTWPAKRPSKKHR